MTLSHYSQIEKTDKNSLVGNVLFSVTQGVFGLETFRSSLYHKTLYVNVGISLLSYLKHLKF